MMSFVLGGTISLLLSSFDQMQIFIHIPIMKLKIPANAMNFFSTMVPIVTFDVLQNLGFYNNFLKYISQNNKEIN